MKPLLPTLILTAMGLAGWGGSIHGAEPGPETAALHGGYTLYGLADEDQVHGAFAEWRGPAFWHGLSPWVSGGLNQGGSFHLGAGLAYGIDLARDWRVSVLFGPAYFDGGDRLDLGSEFEVFSTLELAWRIGDGRRVTLGLGHVSNAGASDVNPGSEYVRLGLQIPLGQR
jgi:hypothetical protein